MVCNLLSESSELFLLTFILGFAVVGEYESKTIMDAQATAFDGMLKWLGNH